MKLHLAFASATALGLVMATGAFADENEAYLLQDGTGNSASVTQNSNAIAGNQAGTSTDAVNQTGSNNVLVILQSGDDGEIGVRSDTEQYFNPDYPSSGGIPQFTITYQGVNQTSSGAGSNTATLTQNGNGSVIGDLQQTSSGKALGNSATATQTGDNTINHIWQTQNSASVGNVIIATQDGSGNTIDRIDQRGTGTGSSNNSITVDISGNNNGTVHLNGLSNFYSSRAWAAGATQSALIQNNYGLNGATLWPEVYGNVIDLDISGDNNQFGMTQKGTVNTTGTVTISGDNNTFGSYQAGNNNVIGTGGIAGNFNDVGIYQSGDANTATVDVLIGTSDNNGLTIAQVGNNNDANASITGDGNGNASFSGVASTLVANSNGYLSGGVIFQGGTSGNFGNVADLTIVGNNNAFAISSIGNQNQVTGVVDNSNSNSAAVLQVGNSNVASYSQAGAGSNSVAISQ